MSAATQVNLSDLETLLVALIALFVGKGIRGALPWLRQIDLPEAVVGGLAAALLMLLTRPLFGIELRFGNHLRDLLLLVFFSTIGLSAKVHSLISGGRPLLILCLVTILLIVLQNLVGAAVALAWGAHPFFGLLAGGLSFIGGPGTAMAWAKEAEAAGLESARPVGIGAATLAVVVGALLAGPIAGYLIKSKGLKPIASTATEGYAASPTQGITEPVRTTEHGVLVALLVIVISVLLGEAINDRFRSSGVMLPGFLCTLLAGILLANGADAIALRLDPRPIATAGMVSLNLFLAMSLTSTPLSAMFFVIVPLMVNVLGQILVIVSVAYFLLFPLLGRDYDAAVTTAGFLGFGIASMPVAMAAMDEVMKRHGPSPKAFLLVTLAGAFFVDIANAMVAKMFLLLPLFRLG